MASNRSAAYQLVKQIEGSRGPLYLLDEQRRMLFCNAALSQWLNVEPNQLLGMRCDYCTGEWATPLQTMANSLCPPPEAFQGLRTRGALCCRNAGGAAVCRMAEFIPLTTSASDLYAVLTLVAADDALPDSTGSTPAAIGEPNLHEMLQKLAAELRTPFRLERLVGDSAAIRRVRRQVQMAIESNADIVVMGPAGSGREQVARTIHTGGDPNQASPILPLSCGLLDGELLQTTVLAFLRRCGESHPGQLPTLLLLGIDELQIEAQAELLAFLRVPTFHARMLVTARESLLTLAASMRFSRELAYRLSTLVIQLPALAERREDIPLLAQQFLEEHNARGGLQLSGFEPDALDELASLPWTGNLDELAGVVQEACAAAVGGRVAVTDLPDRIRQVNQKAAHPPRAAEPIVLDKVLEDVERELVQRALDRAKGNKAQAARLLGIPRARLFRRLTQLGLEEQRLVWRPSEPETPEESP